MNLKYNPRLFFKEGLMVALALAVGIFSAWRHTQAVSHTVLTDAVQLTRQDILVAVVFFFVFSFILLRSQRAASFILRFFFLLIVLSGSQLVFGSLVASPSDLSLAILLILTLFLFRNVLMHNLAMLLGIAGISSVLGLSLTPATAAIVLAVFSVYDIIAVYRTGHMIRFAEGMVRAGTVFGFLIPTHWRGFFDSSQHAEPGEKFMILGSGDIGLPIVFAGSLVPVSLFGACFVAVFSLVGLFVTHVIFMNQTSRRPMAALPPIATATILGYFIFLTFI